MCNSGNNDHVSGRLRRVFFNLEIFKVEFCIVAANAYRTAGVGRSMSIGIDYVSCLYAVNNCCNVYFGVRVAEVLDINVMPGVWRGEIFAKTLFG